MAGGDHFGGSPGGSEVLRDLRRLRLDVTAFRGPAPQPVSLHLLVFPAPFLDIKFENHLRIVGVLAYHRLAHNEEMEKKA